MLRPRVPCAAAREAALVPATVAALATVADRQATYARPCRNPRLCLQLDPCDGRTGVARSASALRAGADAGTDLE